MDVEIHEKGNADMEPYKSLGEVLYDARRAKFLRQVDVAVKVECERQRISEFERNIRCPNDVERPKLADVLDLSEPYIVKLQLDQVPLGKKEAKFMLRRRPRFENRGDRRPSQRIRAMRTANKALFDRLLRELKKLPEWRAIRTFLLRSPFESQDEVLVIVLVILAFNLVPRSLAPQRCGFRLRPVVDRRNASVIGDCPVPALKGEVRGRRLVIFVQPSLLVGFRQPRPDFLIGLGEGSKVRWAAWEVNGDGHRFSQDETRAEELGFPVLEVPTQWAHTSLFAEELFVRTCQLLRLDKGLPGAEVS